MGTGKRRSSHAPSHPDFHAALLRGINVGGKNRLRMATLVSLFEQAGCTDVRTYIQSGNVVYRPPDRSGTDVPAAVSTSIADELGLQVPVVCRTASELRAVVDNNPFLSDGADPAHCHVGFLAELPGAAQARALDPDRSPGDRFALRGRELYLHLPNGAGRTKLTNAYIDRTLQTTSTLRNWRTVLALVALGDELPL